MQAKKSLGQNFLIDNNVINNIVDSIDAKKDDLIIEIGPGMGALTELLVNKSQVLCYEIDKDMTKYLSKINNLIIKYQDILQSNIKEDIKNITYNNLYIVGNLPYYITTSIIKYLIDSNIDIYKMIFMVQKEVADRFTSKYGSKEYGSITLYLKYYFNITKLFNVSKNSFRPIPKVESAVILFENRLDSPNINKDKYFKLINDSFRMKRKTLKNNLNNYDFVKIKEVLNKYNLPENIRAESIPEEVFLSIYEVIK